MASVSCCTSGNSVDLPRQWNKMIKQEVVGRNPEGAILIYRKMLEDGFHGDNYTFPVLLKASSHLSCSASPHTHIGFVLHAQTLKTGFWNHGFVQTALLNHYSSLQCVDDACKIFKQMTTEKDVIACNSMLDAYASAGQMDNAATLFNSMPIKDPTSYNIMISGYASISSVECARRLFDKMPIADVVSWNSIILAYIKFGDMATARALFDAMPERNVVSWNTMLCGYLQLGLFSRVIDLFSEFCDGGDLRPNHITLTTILSACARIGALGIGARMHIIAMNTKLVLDPRVVSSIIDMYAKCGSIERALEMFYKFEAKDIYCWNVIISGLALHGRAHAALTLFQDMKTRGFSPDDVTFLSLLSACSHEGLVEEGTQLFASMENEFGVIRRSEHYGCMVDLLGRAGFLQSAFRLIETMPFEPEETAWGALLSACIIHQEFEMGEMVAKQMASDLEKFGDGQYMMLANFYALSGKWDDANRWRTMMNKSGINKTAGYSVIEVDGRMFKFLAGDGDSYHESLQE